jgi:hypothetical protein
LDHFHPLAVVLIAAINQLVAILSGQLPSQSFGAHYNPEGSAGPGNGIGHGSGLARAWGGGDQQRFALMATVMHQELSDSLAGETADFRQGLPSVNGASLCRRSGPPGLAKGGRDQADPAEA